MRRKRLAGVRLDVLSTGSQQSQSELVGVEEFFVLHIVPGNAEPTWEGMPALHGDRPRLAYLCLGGYYRRQDRPGARVRDRTKIRGACFNCNEGKCDLPYCCFKQVCAKCGGHHREHQCRGATMKDPPPQDGHGGAGRDFTT